MNQSSLSPAYNTNMFMHYIAKKVYINVEVADEQPNMWVTMDLGILICFNTMIN